MNTDRGEGTGVICGNCQYCEPSETRFGYCHRHPPHPEFPIVRLKVHWCGEFKAEEVEDIVCPKCRKATIRVVSRSAVYCEDCSWVEKADHVPETEERGEVEGATYDEGKSNCAMGWQ